MGFADDTNLTVTYTRHIPQTADDGRTVIQQANDLLDMTISYLSHNIVIVHPAKSVALIKGSATAPPGTTRAPMNVLEATTDLEVNQTANPQDTTPPPKLQSHLGDLPRYASRATKALTLSHQSVVYYLTEVLNASIGIQALHLTHPTTTL